ncbi:MAG: hypothetical protein K8L91_12555 [Anaerolineae bacterium]|nr:hypothetical protein [Anaerolineae bacterium]
MTTLTTYRSTSFVSPLTSPCGEADWLEELQSKSRRIMIVDGCAGSYAIVTHWPAAHQLVKGLLGENAGRPSSLSELRADVISQLAIEEQVEVVILVGSRPQTISRWLGQNPATHINCRTQLPVLAYGE